MSVERVTVNKKGQLTIPSRFRKTLDIKEGTKLLVTQEESTIILRRLPEIDDLLGIHAGKVFQIELQTELDQMRRQDRY